MAQQTKIIRFAVISVEVDENWLTCDGDQSKEAGWWDLEYNWKTMLHCKEMFCREHGHPVLSFVDWDEILEA